MKDFKSLLKKYRFLFFDAYGVIRNYNGLIPGIKHTFDWLDARHSFSFGRCTA